MDRLVVERKKLSELMPAGYNPRTISPDAFEGLKKSIRRFGIVEPIVWNKRTGNIVGGHQRCKALKAEGVVETDVVVVDLPDKDEVVLNITLNNPAVRGHWTDGVNDLLARVPADMADDISAEALKDWLAENSETEKEDSSASKASLSDPFTVEPTTILDAKMGPWQDRKNLWKSLGLQSDLGRGEKGPLTFVGRADAKDFVSSKILKSVGAGTSIFDPVLCEMLYKWYCPAGGVVLDPFAGGSVRGIVAAKLGYRYVGIDLRPEQVEANFKQAETIVPENKPMWLVGDSVNLPSLVGDGSFDFVLSCPPYFDLEVYSEDPKDLSTMKWGPFCDSYGDIIRKAVACLRPGRFCSFVVGDVRDSEGFYRNFVGVTIEAFERAGARLYNEMSFLMPIGHLALRAGGQFSLSRKLGKTHQNVLVFRKAEPAEDRP
jgi:hypothetical protein